ncbi:hypothetical protein FRC08_003823 [Ceratobasidium sp. 394]|nr:hypothetical protein FRC08_003823 [Ceratobasidium sp. 394]
MVPITDHHDAQPKSLVGEKSRTTNTGALTSTAFDSSLLPPSPAPSRPANQNAATAPKGTKSGDERGDGEAAPKGKTAGANAATNHTDSWSASYLFVVASLPPPLAPEKTKKKTADLPAQPAPSPLEASTLPIH